MAANGGKAVKLAILGATIFCALIWPSVSFAATIEGTAGLDNLYGSAHADTIHGYGAADSLYGRGGADHLYGGRGQDVMQGGLGSDVLRGGRGNDELYAHDGRYDIVRCGPGSDDFAYIDWGLDDMLGCERGIA
jgi:Ca2+-binding RTX toxin-like protein